MRNKIVMCTGGMPCPTSCEFGLSPLRVRWLLGPQNFDLLFDLLVLRTQDRLAIQMLQKSHSGVPDAYWCQRQAGQGNRMAPLGQSYLVAMVLELVWVLTLASVVAPV